MFEDLFYQTHHGEIFVKSQCMQHESSVMEFFRSCLTNLGYVTDDASRRVWKRHNRQVIVCLADDFNVCGAQLDKPPADWFDPNTVVITDNHITVPTQYTVCQLPTSYLGVFSYVPDSQDYAPERRFNFSVNRLDTQRELIFLELVRQLGGFDQLLALDFVNFNAWDSSGANQDLDQIRNNVKKYWNQLDSACHNVYGELFVELVCQVPIKNHSWSIEQANLRSWLVPVVETYSGNITMAFSEKIFRALQTPMPWTVYSATGAVEYLKSLNFDVLEDLIDHGYNTIHQDSPYGLAKIARFVDSSLRNVTRLQNLDIEQIKQRCRQAAIHNQSVLAQMRRQWPNDFAQWLPSVIDKIQ